MARNALLICWFVVLSLMDMMNTLPQPRPITNGQAASNSQFPFAVSFGYRNSDTSFSHFCGGTLISKNNSSAWAISAAHCFLDIKNRAIYALIGGGDLNANDAKWCRVLEIVSADMNVYTFQNDIALVNIQIDSDISHQQVIERAREMPTTRANCVIYGYGSISYYANTKTTNQLRYGRVHPISYDQCEILMGRVTAPYEGTGQFCALGEHGVDACFGDSGTGLICPQGGHGFYELLGIASYGSGCGENVAGIYQSVIHHEEWIDSVLKEKN